MTGDPAPIIAFNMARLNEDEVRVYREGTPPNGVIAWLTYLEADGSMGYTTVAHGDAVDGLWIADGKELAPPADVLVVHDPTRALRQVAAGRRILARHHDDGHGYCADCEIVIDYCPELRDQASVWSDDPGYQQRWASA